MNQDLKSFLLAFVPGVISLFGSLWVAYSVTRKSETERLEFQKESELQKQRMELYKMLFAERIAAAKEISKLTAAAYHEIVIHFSSEGTVNWEIHRTALHVMVQSANANQYIFNSSVNKKISAFSILTTTYTNTPVNAGTWNTRNAIVDQLNAASVEMNNAISAMMSDNNFSDLLKIPEPKAIARKRNWLKRKSEP